MCSFPKPQEASLSMSVHAGEICQRGEGASARNRQGLGSGQLNANPILINDYSPERLLELRSSVAFSAKCWLSQDGMVPAKLMLVRARVVRFAQGCCMLHIAGRKSESYVTTYNSRAHPTTCSKYNYGIIYAIRICKH